MAEIPIGRAIGHLKAVATPSRAGKQIVSARIGVFHQWMGLDEAISLVRLAKRCFLRDGSNFGSRIGAIAKCPTDPATNKPKLPEADKHCDSVAGATLSGGTSF